MLLNTTERNLKNCPSPDQRRSALYQHGRRSTSFAHLVIAAWLALLCARPGSAICVGGGTSSVAPPAVTYLRSYRAPFGVPTRMAVDTSGNVYVSDPALGQVIVRAPSGRVVARLGGLARPIGVAVGDAGRTYVGDGESGSVTAFGPDWQPLFQLGQGAGEFRLPNDLAVDAATGNIYVADSEAQQIKVYDAAGAFQQSFGGQGNGDGQFNFPVGVVVDAGARQVLVADQLNYRIQVFDTAGNFLYCFGAHGSQAGKFNTPQGVAIDGRSRVYVADSLEGRIQVLDRNGDFVGYIGDFGQAPGQLRIPMGMVIDPSNRLFIAAANNARLEVFGLDTFADPETILPAVFHLESNPIDRATSTDRIAGYLEVPGYSLDPVVPGAIAANGVSAVAVSITAADHDGNGVPDIRVEFDRAALLSTLPMEGAGTVAVSGTLGTKQFEGSAAVQITTCGPATICSLGVADPQCNQAVCVAAVGCAIQPKADGTGCEDGNACTVEDVCSGGICVGAPLSCNDGNVCTDDSCDAVSGCVYSDNSAPCDDANACTAGDACSGGVCSGSPRSCDDANVCTDDTCDPVSGCRHTDNTAPCDDGNACTLADACAGGACGGTPLACNDGNVCTDDTCNPASGCVHTSNTAACDDGNACTVADTCAGGACAGMASTCNDGNLCTDDGCDPASGCVHTGNTAPCDDSDAGTVHDTCDSNGDCLGQVVTGNYAVLRWPLPSAAHASVTLSRDAATRGSVCAEDVQVGSSVQIDGDVVAWTTDGRAISFSRLSQVTGDVVTGGGALAGIGQATVGGRIDQGGTAPELAECFAARYRADRRRAELSALPPTPGFALGAVDVGRGSSRRIPAQGALGSGQVVVEAAGLRLGPESTLTLVGTASTDAVVVHIRGGVVLGWAARIDTDGLPAERVIFVVDGSVILYREAHVAGSVFASRRVRMGSASTITGALLASTIDLAPYATVDLHPFVGW